MKTLTTSKNNLINVWDGLRKVPPRAFSSQGEIEQTAKILEIIANTIPEFVEVMTEDDKLNEELKTLSDLPEGEKEKPLKEWEAKRKEWEKKGNTIKRTEGTTIATVEFEKDPMFGLFFQECRSWAKEWIDDIKSYLQFMKDVADAMSRPKQK